VYVPVSLVSIDLAQLAPLAGPLDRVIDKDGFGAAAILPGTE
jgi:hypothetical protein